MSYIKQKQLRGNFILECPYEVNYDVEDTYQLIGGTWSDGTCCGFHIDGASMSYVGNEPIVCLVNGTSDLSIDIATTIYYGLFLNDELVGETEHTFTSPSKTSNISITRVLEVNPGDYFNVYTKSLNASANIDIKLLSLTFWGNKNK